MIKTALAAIGLAVLAHQGYQLYLKYQRLKTENTCLRRYWKEEVAGKQ